MPRRKGVRRKGFTLLELLLTMTVLAAIAAVSIPHLGLLLGDRRLVRAGEQVRIEMTRVRVDAMRQGRVMMIETINGGNSIRIRPFQSVADATEAIDQTGSQSALLSGAKQGTMITVATDSTQRLVELPVEVSVESVNVVSAARAMEIERLSIAELAGRWSRPILFYPDGSTSTAVVVLKHQSFGRLTVRLRGITGEATLDEVMP